MSILFPVLRRDAGRLSGKAPAAARCRAELDAARSSPPALPGPGAGPSRPAPPAAMGSEMEPLLLAWSYFRRRKFQLCADLCTQMLEKSPYDQVPAGPVSLVDPGDKTEGSGGCPGPREGSREEGPG